MKALEYGCGTGLLSFALQSELGQITLADTSQGMLDVLAEKIKTAGVENMVPVRLDLSVDPLPVEHYHFIYSLMTLHHIPDTEDILRRFHAVLEPGGYLCIADLEQEDGSYHDVPMMDIHHGFKQEKLRLQVEAAGFHKTNFFHVYRIPKGQREYPLFLMTAERT